MRTKQILLGIACLTVGSLVGCAAALIDTGSYTLRFPDDGESAELTVMTDMVILEYEDAEGSAYVEYTVTSRGGCKGQF